MRDGTQIAWIVIGCVAGFALVLAGLGAYWWSHQGRVWLAEGKVAFEEGRALGPSGDNHMCLDRSLDRFGQCGGMGCEIGVLVFFNACLAEAEADPGFCDGVPAETEIFDSVFWRQRRCETEGFGGDFCQQIFGSVQNYCTRLRQRGLAAAAPS